LKASSRYGALAGTLMLFASPFAVGQAALTTIVGSAHDFSSKTWSGGKVCVVCHTPHKADTSVSDAPLWSHANSSATYTMYTSSTFLQRVGTAPSAPGANSKMCLSCHDGSISVDSFISGGVMQTGTTKISDVNNIGKVGLAGTGSNDLRDDHPIGVSYTTVRTADAGGYRDPATSVTIGQNPTKTGALSALLLQNGNVECSSCHDVHNTYVVLPSVGTGGMVKMGQAGTGVTALCTACHVK
jgi:hypothetical protein